jgi:F420-dependent oxidoreductase-like protein
MIEGQEDVTWSQWVAIGNACDEHGLEGLYRSDHYSSVQERTERGSLDAWATLAGLAVTTTRVRLGTLVSPATFRHPSVVAKTAATVDHISGGRVTLGLGAGWFIDEHRSYGFEFPATKARIQMLSEQLEIVHRQWTTEEPFDFTGGYYELQSCEARPKPVQRPHPPIIVGGSGGARSCRLAARWGDEYNTTFPTVEQCRNRRERVLEEWVAQGRDESSLRFSVMTGIVGGPTKRDVEARARGIMDASAESGDPGRWLDGLASQWVTGTTDRVVERLAELQEAGVDGVMLQHQLHADLDLIAWLGEEVRPQVARGDDVTEEQ